MDDFTGIAIVGILGSVITEWISETFGVDSTKAKVAAILVSLVGGTIYYFAKDASWWTSVIGALAASSTTYAFIFNKKSEVK